MKTLLIRAFVLALVVSGATATAHSKTTGHAALTNSGFPVPMCPINDPTGCGIDGNGGSRN